MSTPVPLGAYPSPPPSQTIDDGFTDLAQRFNGEKLRVNATGRKTFQKCFLWTQSRDAAVDRTKKTKESYDPNKHSPNAVPTPNNKLPLASELVNDEATTEFIQVGLILADNPELFLKEIKNGVSRSREIEQARASRVLDRDEHNVLYAYVEITESRVAQAETFVGCLFKDGHYEIKKAKQEWVFFFAEFQPTINGKVMDAKASKPLNQAERKGAIIFNVKSAASRNPTVRGANVIAKAAGIRAANPIRVPKPASLSSKLRILLAVFDQTGSSAALQTVLDTLEHTQPGLRYQASTRVQGTTAFFDFNTEFTIELSQAMEQELKVCISNQHATAQLYSSLY